MKRTRPARTGSLDIRWPVVLGGGLAGTFVAVLYILRLGSLVGPGSIEKYSVTQLASIGGLAANPLLLPYKLTAFILLQLPGANLIAARLASVAVAIASIVLFYLVARRWYGALNGTATTILFATSSWMLHTGRFAAGYSVLVFFVVALLNLAVWTKSSERSDWLTVGFSLALVLALFAPSGIWFALAFAALLLPLIREHIAESQLKYRLIAAAIACAGLAVSVAGYARSPGIIMQGLGVPEHFPGIVSLLKQAALGISAFTLRGPGTPETWLAHTPILDVAGVALLLIGTVFYSRHFDNPRTRLLAGFTALGLVFVTLNGAAALGLLVPTVYLVVGGGIAYFMHQWKQIFPRNPIANGTAVAAICLLLAAMTGFQLQRYFLAWPNSPETIRTYNQANDRRSSVPYLIQ